MELIAKQKELDIQIDVSRLNRPNVGEVCGRWTHFGKLWEEADDSEREALMAGMVRRVDVNQKEEGTCEIAVIPQVPSHWLELASKMGAAGEVIAINPPRLTTHTFPPVELDYDIIRPKRKMRRCSVFSHTIDTV